jgi:alkylation response protein AidB-like acyl-CoA dehydrogenase
MIHGTDALRALVETAHGVSDTVIRAHADEDDRAARWPAESMRALAEAGLLGLHVPPAHGGHGQGLTALALVSQEIARWHPSAALCYAMHCVGTAVIAAKATPHQREQYLRPIAEGRHVTTLALSEPGTGAHFYLPETALRADGEEYVLNGTKSFVTNGAHADSYVLSTAATAPNSAGTGEFSAVIVDHDCPGLEWDREWAGFGMRSNSSRTLHLHEARVPCENLLGEEGDQLWYVFEVVAPYFLMAMAGTYTGIATACFDEARAHLGERRHSHTGELLGAEPVLANELGRLWTRAESTRQLVYAAAARADAGEADALAGVLACKLAAAETAVALANDAMTLGGGRAYAENSRLARLLRDARAGHVMAPTTHMLRTWLGRALLGLPLLG